MMMGPQLYLILALVVAIPSTYGIMHLKMKIAVAHAFNDGQTAGAAQAAARVIESSQATVAAVIEGEAAAPIVSPEKAKIMELCQRSSSCRERVKQ